MLHLRKKKVNWFQIWKLCTWSFFWILFYVLDDIWRNSQSRWAVHACQCWANWWGEAVNSNKRKTFCQLLSGWLCLFPKNGQKLERKSPRAKRAGVSDGCDWNTGILMHAFTPVPDLLPHALTHTGCLMTPNVCYRMNVRVKKCRCEWRLPLVRVGSCSCRKPRLFPCATTLYSPWRGRGSWPDLQRSPPCWRSGDQRRRSCRGLRRASACSCASWKVFHTAHGNVCRSREENRVKVKRWWEEEQTFNTILKSKNSSSPRSEEEKTEDKRGSETI